MSTCYDCDQLTVGRCWRHSFTPALEVKADRDGDIHVMPHYAGERAHEPSVSCWCRPQRDRLDVRVVVHERRPEA